MPCTASAWLDLAAPCRPDAASARHLAGARGEAAAVDISPLFSVQLDPKAFLVLIFSTFGL